MPMGRDLLTSRATANPSISLVTAERSILRVRAPVLTLRLVEFRIPLNSTLGPAVRYRRVIVLVVVVLAGAMLPGVRQVSGDEWQPISPEELKMTSEPLAPGAPAIYLYRQVDRNDSGRAASEYNYVRIKILTEEGRNNANVEIPFEKGRTNVVSIKARTIRPDGSAVNYDGKVFENTIVKSKTLKYLAKTFTMPEVEVGSIIEYHFNYDLRTTTFFLPIGSSVKNYSPSVPRSL